MGEETRRTPLFRPLGILTAITLALYLWVVWDPIDIYGDVRRYLEHRVNFPLEWIIGLFLLAWIICRKEDYTIGTVALSVLFVIILTLSSPDYGVWFWRMFRHEIYLAPTHIPRGLVIYFFLFCFVVLAKVRLKQERKNTLLACLVIAFTLTSCEAVFAEPSIAVQYTNSGADNSYGEQWREKAQEGWGVIIRLINQYIPVNYQHAAKIVASLYPFVAAVLLLFSGYRKLPHGVLGLSFWAHEVVYTSRSALSAPLAS